MSAESSKLPAQPEWAAASKIAPRHLERLAVVYVRQSTTQQLVRHQESTRLQYGLVERALALGWPRERVVVIDDDLGRSGVSAEGRPGFQRLVAEVGLDHVGVILGAEMSRLARSCRDWHQLLEVCALFGTLIADMDGLYAPSNYNDRLLLGLKGTMSEAELHVLKQRMLQGKLQKARRGELGMMVPIGYVRRPSGEVAKDPDEQVQSVVQLVFAQFEARGTVNGVLRYLVDNGIKVPVRLTSGPTKGELEWRRPNRVTLQNLLHNPAYAGAYVYGRRPVDPRRKKPGRPGTGKTVAAPGSWQVILKDRLPAYINWEQYERNLEQLNENRAQALGAPRNGPALLSGLLRCGRCGRRMTVTYGGGYHRYVCSRDAADYGEPLCQSLAGRILDARMRELVLEALMPSALEVSLKVADDLEAEHARLAESWHQRLERARYEAERALRQYNAVEPENRLVARGLESQLEEKLAAQKCLEEEHRRWLVRQPSPVSEEERQAIRALARDIPGLWTAPSTTPAERQTILRQLMEEVVVKTLGETERVEVSIQWAGGHRTETTVVRPVARLEQLSYWPKLVKRIEELRGQGLTSRRVAEQLNTEGWRPPKRRSTFTGDMVRTILSRRGLVGRKRRNRKQPAGALRPNEWRLTELAAKLSMPSITLYSWMKRGWVKGRQLEEVRRPWVIEADAKELKRLAAFRTAPKHRWPRTRAPVAHT
jgi:DNA invertase Pin-like site-specific DNA recombinase